MGPRRVLTIFFGSPDDLSDERHIARTIVESVNQHVARNLDTQLELRGWEDTLPGAGRPQELINKDIRESSLFVGVLWRRWGTPTADYSSGFLEEFTLANQLKDQGALSDVWLFLKDLGDVSDPGDQLRQVIEFRRQVVERREALYKTFSIPDEFGLKLFAYLADYLTRSLGSTPSTPVASPSSLGPPPASLPVEEPSSRVTSSSLRVLLEAAAERPGDLSEPEAVRLFVLAAAELYWRHLPSEVLGAHESQLLFAQRSSVELNRDERLLILRTLIADASDSKAGWWWFAQEDIEAERLLAAFAMDRRSVAAQHGAASLLTKLPALRGLAVALEMLSSDDYLIQDAALCILARQGTPSEITRLEQVLGEDPGLNDREARAAIITVLRRTNPASALTWYRALKPVERMGLRSSVRDLVLALPAADVAALTKDSDAVLRAASIEQSVSGLHDSDLLALKADPDYSARSVIWREIVSRGLPVSPDEIRKGLGPPEGANEVAKALIEEKAADLIVAAYRSLPHSDIEARIKWIGGDGPLAYRALAEQKSPESHAGVRADVSTGFISIRDALRSTYVNSDGTPLAGFEEMLPSIDDLEPYVRSRFVTAALAALATGATPDDADFVAAQDTDVLPWDWLPHGLAIMEAAAEEKHVPWLLKVAAEASGSEQERAVALAVKLAGDKEQVSRSLFGLGNTPVARMVISALRLWGGIVSGDFLIELLLSEDEATRKRSVAYAADTLSRDHLEELLEEYLTHDPYFYNVVAWLDRLLYAPVGLREVFRAILLEDTPSR